MVPSGFDHRSLSEEQADFYMRPYTKRSKLSLANFMFGDATIMLLQDSDRGRMLKYRTLADTSRRSDLLTVHQEGNG